MTDKPKHNNQGITQADGVREAPEVLDNADSAETPAPPAKRGRKGETLPVEPDDQKATRLEAELDQVKDQHLRLAAEFDNFKKRISRERAETESRAQGAIVVRMLEVLDDLDRLIADESAAGQTGPIYDATVLINKKLRKELEASGLSAIDPTGQPFDPKLHEAVATVPAPDASKDHLVAATFQTGYAFKGNLIRPAMVQVYSDQGHV